MNPYRFPRNFAWGVATAAPQIEGAARQDGRGESIWDRFARRPGRILGRDTLDTACDHYHRFREDFALLRQLGVKHYRLSIAWPRIFPEGTGAPNAKGIDFYHRLFDALAAEGITPWVTFYHWDLPQALEAIGGWRVRAIPEAFANYADTVVKAYGDRVKHWITVNEIPCFIGLSYKTGYHAPGAREPDQVVHQAYHHALLAHGHAVRAVREHGGRGARVGLTHNPDIAIPVTETPADIAAAGRDFAEANAHVLAPIFTGRYPAEYLRRCGANRPVWRKGDLELVSQPTDFLGLNVYTGYFVRAASPRRRPERLPFPDQYPRGAQEWLYHAPQSMYWAVRHCHEIYRPPAIYITENGVGYDEPPGAGREIIDLHRRDYLRNYLVNLHRAIAEGLPCRGYFLWSLLDSFEWTYGYSKRFGIVHVDFATQRRTPKLSARWYSRVVAENRLV